MIDDTRELVTAAQFGALLLASSVLGAGAAVVLAALAKRKSCAIARRGAWLAGGGALLFPLWSVYNAIENHFGLDSVAALGINLVLFAGLGAAAGLVLRRVGPR